MSEIARIRFQRLAWAVLAYTVLVILFGAWVRITGSGAGCGEHWPSCHGAIVPRSPSIATVIEFTHRVTSGLCLVAVLGLLWMARRSYPAGHAVRLGAALACCSRSPRRSSAPAWSASASSPRTTRSPALK